MSKTLKIYACGGAGVNIGKQLQDHPSQQGFADIEVCYIDTSLSNMPADIDSTLAFVLPGVDGSGKIRAQNYADIANNVPQILARFAPADFNIVVHSGSGGSGSVFGPLLANLLVGQGHPTVSLVVGSWESLITVNNTINTLKSMDNLARKNGHPLVFTFFNNEDNTLRRQVDASVLYYINRLACLASGEHSELDSSDIANWLRYDRNPNNQTPISLTHLDILESDEEAMEINYPIAIASLHTGMSQIGAAGADYQCAGILDEQIASKLGFKEQHYVLTVNDLGELMKRLTDRKEQLVQKQQSRPKTQSILGVDTPTTDDNMVL